MTNVSQTLSLSPSSLSPLAIKNVKFKVLNTKISDDPLQRGGGGQFILTNCGVAFSAFLRVRPL